MKDTFAYDVAQVAWILVGMAVLMAGIQGGAIRRLVERHGEKPLLLVGVSLMAVSFFAIPWPATVGLLLMTATFAWVSDGFDAERTTEDWWRLAVSGVVGIAVADTLFLEGLRRLGPGLSAIASRVSGLTSRSG